MAKKKAAKKKAAKETTRPVVKSRVIRALQDALDGFGSNVVVNSNEKQNLSRDLGMSLPFKQAMGTVYSKISRDFKGGISVSMDVAGKFKTVKDAVNGTFKRAKGELS